MLIGLSIGYALNWVVRRLHELTKAVVTLSQRKADIPEPKKPHTFIADPDDLALRARFEREEARRNLNE